MTNDRLIPPAQQSTGSPKECGRWESWQASIGQV